MRFVVTAAPVLSARTRWTNSFAAAQRGSAGRLSSGKEENLAEIRNKITLIKGSITDIEVVRKAMHEAEYVLHLAARTSVPKSVKDPSKRIVSISTAR